MLTIKTHLKSLVTSSLYLSNVGTLVLRGIFFRSRPPLLREEGDFVFLTPRVGQQSRERWVNVKSRSPAPDGAKDAMGLAPLRG